MGKTIRLALLVAACVGLLSTSCKKDEAAENRKAGEKFLAANAKKEGVIVTESGLQYKILTEGTGEVPVETDVVRVYYKGTYIGGKEFGRQLQHPFRTAISSNIKGWQEALVLMPTGSKWKLFIPYDLGYGSSDYGSIPAYSVLIFEVELVSIDRVYKAENEAFLTENATKEGVTTTASGLQYEIMRQGTGEKPAASNVVSIHYKETLLDGTETYSTGEEPSSKFMVSDYNRGWSEALQLMPVGSKWKLYVGYKLGWGSGDDPKVPPYSTTIVELELLDIVE